MKIALLIAGQIRNKNITFNDWIKKYNMDVFLSSDYKYGERHNKNKNIPLEERFLSKNEIINVNDLKIANLKKYNLEQMKLYHHYFEIHSSLIDYCEKKHPNYNIIGTVYNIYHINKCLEMLLEYEKKNGKYDIIIKIRPDLLMNNNSNLDFENIKLEKIIFSKNQSNHFQKSDKFFYSKRNLFINFINKLISFCKNEWIKKKEIKFESLPIGERLFHIIVTNYRFKYFILKDYKTKVIR